MKTHEDLVEEFRQEFEKKRKKAIRALWYEIPYFLFLTTLFLVMSSVLIGISLVDIDTLHSPNLATKIALFVLEDNINTTNPPDATIKIALFVLGLCTLWLGGFISCISFKEILDAYNVQRLVDSEKKSLDTLRQSRTQEETNLLKIEENLVGKQNFINLIQNPKITLITPEPIWPNYIIGMAKKDRENIETIQKSIISLNERIASVEATLEVYDQTSERNFWQYLKSGKWIRKQTTLKQLPVGN